MSTATLLTHPQWVRDAPTSLPGEGVLSAAIVRPVRSTKNTVCGIVERLSMELLKTSGGEVVSKNGTARVSAGCVYSRQSDLDEGDVMLFREELCGVSK